MKHRPFTDPKFKKATRVVADAFGPRFQKAYAAFAWWGIASGTLKTTRPEVVQDPPGYPERQRSAFRKLHQRAVLSALSTVIAVAPARKVSHEHLHALGAGLDDPALWANISDAEIAAYMAYLSFFNRVVHLLASSRRIRGDRHAERLFNNWHRLHNTMLIRKLEQAARLGGLVVTMQGKGVNARSEFAFPAELANGGQK